MAVQPESLETLEKADVPPAQARAIVRAIEIELAGARDTLATKPDLLSLRVDLRQELAEFRTEFNENLAELRSEFNEKLAEFRAEFNTKLAELRTEFHAEIATLRTEIHASASSTVRQMYMALLGQMAVLLGFAYFFATHVR